LLKAYLELLKLRQTALLVWTAFAAYISVAGSELDSLVLGQITLSIFLTVSGTTATSMYVDADIDAIMERTKERPIPSDRVNPNKGLAFGLILFSLGILLAVFINWLVVFVVFLGFFGDVVVYGRVLKRRTPLSIVFGGIAGGMPTLAGWTAYTNSIELGGILLALLVMAWIPAHILTLAMFHVDDYHTARVPMLPVVVSAKRTREIIILSDLILITIALGLYFFDIFGKTYLVLSIVPTLLFLFGSIRMLIRFSKERYWTLFKVSGPYLLILYIAMIIDVITPIF